MISREATGIKQEKIKQEKIKRTLICAALVLLMASSCSICADEHVIRAVSLPAAEYENRGDTMRSLADVYETLESQRQQEIALLDGILKDSEEQEIRDMAFKQKAEIVRRMESERLACAVLTGLGCTAYYVSCGAEVLTVFLPVSYAGNAGFITSIIEGTSEQTGIPAASVKIILVKNET